MRIPLALLMLGPNSSKIKPEHIKFLTDFDSPFPFIYIIKQA